MKKLVKSILVIIVMIATTGIGFGQDGMVYLTHQEMTLAAANGLSETWVQLPNDEYVRATYAGGIVTIESTAGWTETIPHTNSPCIAEYNGTIWAAMAQVGGNEVTIGGITHPAPPEGDEYTLLVKLSSAGSILGSWQANGSMNLLNIAVKNNSEIAVVGTGGIALEHLTSPDGGGVVLIHDGNDWDTTKGFFIETPGGGSKPRITSAQYLPNGNLALAGETYAGAVSFGGIPLPSHGGRDGFRGEITSQGVGIIACQMAGNGTDSHSLQITKADGSYMVSGTYTDPLTFYNEDGSIGGTVGQFPAGSTHDHIYFALYNASGVFQHSEVYYNVDAGTDLLNIDLVYGNGAFYAMIGNTNGGTVITPTGSHDRVAPIILKFDGITGEALWSKQVADVGSNAPVQYGEEILVEEDIVTICGTEYWHCDIDFDASVVEVSETSFFAEYFDGVITAPEAGFSGTPTTLVEGETVNYLDESLDGTDPINSWIWTFEGGTPGTYSGQNPPAIVYNTPGDYDVTLEVSDGSLSDTEVKTSYIHVAAYTLSVNPTSETISADAGNTSFDVTSNGPWTTSSNQSWATATDSGNGNGTVMISVTENENINDRVAVITVMVGSLMETFTLTQMGADAFILLTPDNATVSAEEGSTVFNVNCTEGLLWNVADGSWNSASPVSGIGPGTVTISYEANPLQTSRFDDISVSNTAYAVMDTFTITQVGMVPELSISPQTVTVSASSGNTSFDISSNEDWTIETSDPLVTASPSSGNGSETVNISYPAIYTMAGMTYTVTITSASSLVEVFTINQDGVDAFLTLSDYEETVGSDAGSYSIVIDCPTDMTWTATAGVFSNASPNAGTGIMTVLINYEENTSSEERVDILTFSGNGESVDFTLIQVGIGAPLEVVTSSSVVVITAGNALQLFASITGGTGNYTTDWTGPEEFTSIEEDPMVIPLEDGPHTYTVIVNDGENTVTGEVTINVYYVSFYLEVNPLSGNTSTEFSFYSEIVQDPNDPRTVIYHAIEFGDGNFFEGTGSIEETTHIYEQYGVYDIEQSYVLSDGSSEDTTHLGIIDVATSVGENPTEESNNFKIYPNPTNGPLFISTGKSPKTVSVVSMTGSEVIHVENFGEMTQVDLGSLPSGIYFVRIIYKNQIVIKKIEKR